MNGIAVAMQSVKVQYLCRARDKIRRRLLNCEEQIQWHDHVLYSRSSGIFTSHLRRVDNTLTCSVQQWKRTMQFHATSDRPSSISCTVESTTCPERHLSCMPPYISRGDETLSLGSRFAFFFNNVCDSARAGGEAELQLIVVGRPS